MYMMNIMGSFALLIQPIYAMLEKNKENQQNGQIPIPDINDMGEEQRGLL